MARGGGPGLDCRSFFRDGPDGLKGVLEALEESADERLSVERLGLGGEPGGGVAAAVSGEHQEERGAHSQSGPARRSSFQFTFVALMQNGEPGNSRMPPHSNSSLPSGPMPNFAPPWVAKTSTPYR